MWDDPRWKEPGTSEMRRHQHVGRLLHLAQARVRRLRAASRSRIKHAQHCTQHCTGTALHRTTFGFRPGGRAGGARLTPNKKHTSTHAPATARPRHSTNHCTAHTAHHTVLQQQQGQCQRTCSRRLFSPRPDSSAHCSTRPLQPVLSAVRGQPAYLQPAHCQP